MENAIYVPLFPGTNSMPLTELDATLTLLTGFPLSLMTFALAPVPPPSSPSLNRTISFTL